MNEGRIYSVTHWERRAPAHPYIGSMVVDADHSRPVLWYRGWTTTPHAQILPRAAAARMLRRFRRRGCTITRQA